MYLPLMECHKSFSRIDCAVTPEAEISEGGRGGAGWTRVKEADTKTRRFYVRIKREKKRLVK